MPRYRIRHAVIAERELELETPSPDLAALEALGWRQDPRQGCFVSRAQTYQDAPGIFVYDLEGNLLVELVDATRGPQFTDEEKEEDIL